MRPEPEELKDANPEFSSSGGVESHDLEEDYEETSEDVEGFVIVGIDLTNGSAKCLEL